MHMADALLSPAVGGAMWAASAAAICCSSARVQRSLDDRKVPLMAVLGAFVFAAQMINFSIPGTGSSGHLGGGLLLTILLGPSAAFLTVSSILLVQSLFFADGGLLALGCNIFNLGFIPCFLIFPFCYAVMAGRHPGGKRVTVATLVSAVFALQTASLAVVLETVCSGISALPPRTFLMLMQPIHLAIGLVEGVVTLAVVSFLRAARPDLLRTPAMPLRMAGGKVVVTLLVCALITAGVLSSVASKNPDGLQWSIAKTVGGKTLTAPQHEVHRTAAELQRHTAWLGKEGSGADIGTGAAGVTGSLLTLMVVFLSAFMLKKKGRA